MNAKRIIAPDMRRALKIVREQLGENAVILQNRTIAEGVELIATSEEFATLVTGTAHTVKRVDTAPAPAKPLPQAVPEKSDKLIRGRVRKLGGLERFIKTDKSVPTRSQAQSSKTDQFAQMLSAASEQLASASEASEDSATPETQTPETHKTLPIVGESAADRYALKALPPESTQSLGAGQKNASTRVAAAGGVQPQEGASDQRADKSALVEGFEVAIGTLRDEVAMLRSLLVSQSAQQQWDHYQYVEPLRAHLMQKLVGVGFSPNLSRQWVSNIESAQSLRAAWHALLSVVFEQLPVLEPGLFAGSDAMVLLGPTGAGKTATISKIAAAYVLETGQKDLAILSTDSYRMGAQDELGRLSQILDVPMHVVENHAELARLLASYAGRRKVLIDTAGLVSSDPAWAEQCQTLEAARQTVRHFLVLSSTHQLPVHNKALAEYGRLPLHGCILSKLDECARLAETLSAVIEARLPVAYVTTGMRLPEDLVMADRLSLIKQAFGGVDQAQVAAALMAQCFDFSPAGVGWAAGQGQRASSTDCL